MENTPLNIPLQVFRLRTSSLRNPLILLLHEIHPYFRLEVMVNSATLLLKDPDVSMEAFNSQAEILFQLPHSDNSIVKQIEEMGVDMLQLAIIN